MSSPSALLERPRPPSDLVAIEHAAAPDRFVPAPEVLDWIRGAYLAEDGPLYTPDHAHLGEATIGCLWTNGENVKRGRRIVGQAEMPGAGGGDKWATGRKHQQLRAWFEDVPDFLLTFDAYYAADCDDAEFAALVDHELYHCVQAIDKEGSPKFDRLTGMPMYDLRGHDVEEFVGVVRRFGIQAAGQAATELVIAAAQKPEIAPAKLAQACGTCLKVAA